MSEHTTTKYLYTVEEKFRRHTVRAYSETLGIGEDDNADDYSSRVDVLIDQMSHTEFLSRLSEAIENMLDASVQEVSQPRFTPRL